MNNYIVKIEAETHDIGAAESIVLRLRDTKYGDINEMLPDACQLIKSLVGFNTDQADFRLVSRASAMITARFTCGDEEVGSTASVMISPVKG